jgi:L-ascorbate metabolism protein UlaG (beta-lactamase superfamily)
MMFKTVFFIFITLGIHSVEARVTARWLTVASLVIDDGKTRLLFDPAWTRPQLKHVLNWEKLKSDEDLVQRVLTKNKLNRVDAVFASHSHFDHVLDAPMVAKLSGAIFYTDESSERLAKAYKEPRIRTIRLIPHEKIKVGDFLITPINREHSQLLHLIHFLPGAVPVDANLSFWDYHVGDTWFYLVEHPEGTILVDQGSEPYVETLKKYTSKLDIIIQGIANRKTDETILDGYLKAFNPQMFIPVHFDNFFTDFNDGAESLLPGIKIDQLMGKMKKTYPLMKADRPLYGKPIVLLERK